MIVIDGSTGEGGGQMLRTALGLSALTGKPFKITNIRKGRCEPGIKEQHLQSVNAVAKLCDAKVEGAELDSMDLEFTPNAIRSGNINVAISTAGSVGLVLQSLLIPAVKTDLRIRIKGGATYGKWAMPIDHFKFVLSPILKRIGYETGVVVKKEGFYPKGGALVEVFSGKAKQFSPIDLMEKGKVVSISGRSVASELLRSARVAERQANSAKSVLFNHFKTDAKIKVEYVNTLNPGSGIQLWVETENSILGGNSLGEIGKKAEIVGEEAANNLIEDFEHGCVDRFTSDQLLPYMALSGCGRFLSSKITDHVKTNAFVIEQFLSVKFNVKDKLIECISK
jgi:RNA 3'-terminal phosphate cyclase (ATP)/RNA 3'-terminal phosphate cyclase (GTP)